MRHLPSMRHDDRPMITPVRSDLEVPRLIPSIKGAVRAIRNPHRDMIGVGQKRQILKNEVAILENTLAKSNDKDSESFKEAQEALNRISNHFDLEEISADQQTKKKVSGTFFAV